MKRLTYLTALAGVLLALGFGSQTVQAHVLETDNGVSAVLHMPPDDVPLAGQPTQIDLAFAAADPDFSLADYRTEIHLMRGNEALATATVEAPSGLNRNGSATLTFPDRGAYRLIVQGTPQQGADRAFRLGFSVRAIRSDGSEPNAWQAAGSDFWALSAGSLTVLAIVARYNIIRGKRYR